MPRINMICPTQCTVEMGISEKLKVCLLNFADNFITLLMRLVGGP